MYFRARYYDPQTGEFISQDPMEYVGGMSLYRGYFVPGAVDPYGKDIWDYLAGREGFIPGRNTKAKLAIAANVGAALIQTNVDLADYIPQPVVEALQNYFDSCDKAGCGIIGFSLGFDFASTFPYAVPGKDYSTTPFAVGGGAKGYAVALCASREICFFPNVSAGVGSNIGIGASFDFQGGVLRGGGVCNSNQLLGTSSSFDVAAGYYTANPLTKIPAGGGAFGGGTLVAGGGAFGEVGGQLGVGMQGGGVTSLVRKGSTPSKICITIPPRAGAGNGIPFSSCDSNR